MVRMRGNTTPFLALTLGALVFAAACKKEVEPTPSPARTQEVAKQDAPAKVEREQAGPASVSGQSLAECIAPFSEDGEEVTGTLAGREIVRKGNALSFVDGGEKVVFGVLANLKEDTPENRANMPRYVEHFRSQGVDAVLVPGDVAQEKEHLVTLLGELAKSEVPVLVVPGNNEPRDQYQAAMKELADSHPNVVDMSQTRLVRFGAAAVVSLPGYYDPRFFHDAEQGCQYFKEDVDALAEIVEAADQPVVLLSHAEPQGKGEQAIDAIVDGNAGDANLAALMESAGIPFGVFANIQEAGGKATDRNSKPIKENTPSDSLLLNPGVGDAIAWTMNDGTISHGMAAVLKVDASKASYHVFRAPKQEAAAVPDAE